MCTLYSGHMQTVYSFVQLGPNPFVGADILHLLLRPCLKCFVCHNDNRPTSISLQTKRDFANLANVTLNCDKIKVQSCKLTITHKIFISHY